MSFLTNRKEIIVSRVPSENVLCIMSGFNKPIPTKYLDILFINACDMIENEKREQPIKGRAYDGVIRSNLEEIAWGGAGVIIFTSYILIEEINEEADLKFAIRPTDADPELLLQNGHWQYFFPERNEDEN